MRLLAFGAFAAFLRVFVACSSSTTMTPAPTEDAGADASTPLDDAGTPTDATTNDGSATSSTSLTVTLNGTTRTLTRAQFGTNADGTLHVESHLGGDAACPTESSPSPMYTLIVNGVPGTTVTGSFLDFQGDILTGGTPATKATALEVTNAQTTATSTSFDVTITFAEGTATGHIAADHCASLDE